ncbi:MAG: hypothetical protein AAF403_03550 [Pseudomonadota bacterium]
MQQTNPNKNHQANDRSFKFTTLIALARFCAMTLPQHKNDLEQNKIEGDLLDQFALSLEKKQTILLGIEPTGKRKDAFESLIKTSNRMLKQADEMNASNAMVGFLFANQQAKLLYQLQLRALHNNLQEVEVPWTAIAYMAVESHEFNEI